jgi:hypothetical protein
VKALLRWEGGEVWKKRKGDGTHQGESEELEGVNWVVRFCHGKEMEFRSAATQHRTVQNVVHLIISRFVLIRISK